MGKDGIQFERRVSCFLCLILSEHVARFDSQSNECMEDKHMQKGKCNLVERAHTVQHGFLCFSRRALHWSAVFINELCEEVKSYDLTWFVGHNDLVLENMEKNSKSVSMNPKTKPKMTKRYKPLVRRSALALFRASRSACLQNRFELNV